MQHAWANKPYYDDVFKYFLKIFLVAFTKGMGTDEFLIQIKEIPKPLRDNKVICEYLLSTASQLPNALVPHVMKIFLGNQYNCAILNPDTTQDDLDAITLIRTLVECLHDMDYCAFFSTTSLWSKDVRDFAENEIIRRLPIEIQNAY